MRKSIYVAMAENRVIGVNGGLPWRISSDLKRFKQMTMGKPVVMGRGTWAELGKPLPGRHNIVVTSDRQFRADGVETAFSIEDGLQLAEVRGRRMAGADEICIIGGGKVFEQTIGLADRLCITHVLAAVEGDTFFPPIDPAVWRLDSEEYVAAGEKDDFSTRFTVYSRHDAPAGR